MPELKSLVIEKGTQFNNFFVTTPRCCPSRATFLRGQYAHNSRIKNNALPLGGFQKFRRLGRDRSTIATWLDDAGYETAYMGKYLNNYDNTTYIPPGWDQWYGWQGHYYSPEEYKLNENGRLVAYEREDRHDTDLLRDKAVQFVEDREDEKEPFFMYLAPNAPHKPAYVAGRHEGMFSNTVMPRPPSFNERNVADKPKYVQAEPLLPRSRQKHLEELYRRQLASLQSVDDMVGDLVQTLRTSGQLDNTYVVFSSDNGFFYGEHRRENKSLVYEEATKVPFVIRGPGVPAQKLNHLVINNDFAPTVADLAGVNPPGFVDGRSFEPLLQSPAPDARSWRKRFLIELWGPDYKALRTPKYKYVEHSSGERELYDLRKDPYEQRSRHETARPALLRKLGKDLDRLRRCSTVQCRSAERR
jgi:arylsulfatase A-like enzyme